MAAPRIYKEILSPDYLGYRFLKFLLPHAIDEAANRYPNHEAIRIYDESLSYTELVDRSNQLARRLRDHGVKHRDRVGIYMNKCMQTAVAIYGIMKAGAAYVPLDTASSTNRIKFAISDCQIRYLISNQRNKKDLQKLMSQGCEIESVIGIKPDDDFPVRCICWNDVYDDTDKSSIGINIIEQDLAYIMYTSGSTGDPKGIMHTHHSGLSYARWAASAYSLVSSDRLTNHAPLHFDLSTFDYFAGALAAATTVIVPEEYMRLPASYASLLENEKISIFFTVPFALIQLLHRGGLDKHDLENLRWVIFGGEPFPTKHLRDLMKILTYTRFSNMYGPAETNGCTFYNVPELADDSDEPVPIGRICPNVESLVVDENDQQVSTGDIGELLIRSPTMMQGYWRRPDLNEKAFYYRNTLAEFNDVFYRTGDLVRLDKGDNFQFIGRKDRQVKVRGYRIELDEIEAAIVSQNDVEETAVYTVLDSEGSNQLEAAILMRDSADKIPSEKDIIMYLKQRIPGYAIPANIKIRKDFPRTSSGKIDRRELQRQSTRKMGKVR